MSTNIPYGGEKEIVKQAPTLGKRTICIPIDGSQYSRQTLSWAEANLLQKTDLLVLLNVKQPIPPHFSSAMSNEIHQKSRDLLLDQESKLVLDGYLVTAISLQGDPRLELCSEIELLKPTMVVIGTKGTGLLETPLGSTARYISEHCKYPVLIVHPTPALPTLAE